MMKKKTLFVIFLVLVASLHGFAQKNTVKLPPITPRWALEHIVWEDSANNQAAAERLVDDYFRHWMPVGSIIIDSPWSTSYNDFNWDTARYPKPTEMIQGFRSNNVKVILWLTGCVNETAKDTRVQKNPLFDEVVARKFAVNDGRVSTWWKGDGLHLDFTNPEAVKWWNSQLDKVFIDGVYGFKVDQGEIFFGDTVHTSIGDLTNENFRPYYYNSMYQYATSRREGGVIVGRPFSHQGGFEASVEQLNLGWCGDFEGSWEGLKHQISNIYKSAESGYGAPGCEVGGFWKARSGKVELIRYAQFGAMTATMINGGENGAFTNHLPWFHDEETVGCYRQAVWLHSQLVPYLFSTIVDTHLQGGSLIRCVNYEQESHQVGDFLFAKAITSEGRVTFQLSDDSKWMDFWTRKFVDAGSTVSSIYPPNQFPFFLKEGAIIPMNITNDYSGIGDASLAEKQTIVIVPNQTLSVYEFHRPLGDGVAYETIRITHDNARKEILVDGPTKLSYVFLVQSRVRPDKVKGADEWKYTEKNRELRILKEGKKFRVRY